MKTVIPWAGALALIAGASSALGFTYADGDVLLVFRKDSNNDVVYNVGPITPLLNQAKGTTVTVGNWDPAVVKVLYDLDGDARFAVIASTSLSDANRRAWVTTADTAAAFDRTPSQWQTLWSKISGVGGRAQSATGTNAVPVFSVGSSDLSSFTYIASNGGQQPSLISRLGGSSVFAIDAAVPASLRFIEVKPSIVSPKPEAVVIGTFALGTDGVLQFTAGDGSVEPPPAPTIAKIEVTPSGAARVSVRTVAGAQYRLRYTSQLTGTLTSWTSAAGSVAGTGGTVVIEDAVPSGEVRFYAVEATR